MNIAPRAVRVRPFAHLKNGSFPSELNKRHFFTVMMFLDMSNGRTPRRPAELLPIFKEAQRRYPAGNNISTLGLSTYVGAKDCTGTPCNPTYNTCPCDLSKPCHQGLCSN